MRKLLYYVATSLDYKIAKPDGNVDWLHEIPNPEGIDHGYATFYNDIGTTLMGYKTYEQILGFGIDFPYPDKTNFVFSRSNRLASNNPVQFVQGDIINFTKSLKMEPGKPIWLIGGGQIATLLFNAGLIDELMVFVMPIILGDGIPLFANFPVTKSLKLVESKTYSTGAVGLVYQL